MVAQGIQGVVAHWTGLQGYQVGQPALSACDIAPVRLPGGNAGVAWVEAE